MSYLTLLRSLKSAGVQGDKSDNIQKEAARQILSVLSLAGDEDFVAKRTKVLEEIANALAEGAIDVDDAALANASINNTKDASLLDQWRYLVSCCVSAKQHQ
jgi:hypothetical protein